MATRRLYLGAASLAAATIVVVSSAAWACTAFTTLKGPQSGPAESRVTLRGEALIRPHSPTKAVELRWNTVSGPVLAQVEAEAAGQISAPVSIPATAPGVYYILAVVEGRAVARSAFEVTPPPGVAAVTADSTAGLNPADRPTNPAANGSSSFEPGVALLAVGLVVLAAGTGVVVARSTRRVPSGADLTR